MSEWQPMNTAPKFGTIEVTDDARNQHGDIVERVPDIGGGFWSGGANQKRMNFWRFPSPNRSR